MHRRKKGYRLATRGKLSRVIGGRPSEGAAARRGRTWAARGADGASRPELADWYAKYMMREQVAKDCRDERLRRDSLALIAETVLAFRGHRLRRACRQRRRAGDRRFLRVNAPSIGAPTAREDFLLITFAAGPIQKEGSLMVQHYIEEIGQPDHMRLVSVDKRGISPNRFDSFHETASRARPRALRIASALLPLLAASTLLSQTSLSFESRISSNGGGEAVITNRSNLPMVAWIFEILREPCNPIEADRHIYAGYDSALEPDRAALQPLASRVQDIGASHCNKAGTHSPNRASLKVALFADGSSVGDSGWLDILRRDRKVRFQRIGHAVQALRGINGAQTREQCVASLEKARDALPQAEEPQVEYSAPDPFDAAVRELTDNRSAPLNNQIAGLLSHLQTERGRLEKQQ